MTDEKGFTLVELIIVVALLGILAAIAVPNYVNYLYTSRVNTDISTARQLARNADMYRGMKGLSEIPEDYAQSQLNLYKRPESGADDGTYSFEFDSSSYTVIVSFEAVSEKAGKYAGTYKVAAYGNLPHAIEGGMDE